MTRPNPLVLSPDATADLHLHTRASDGGWTPETLVARVTELGVRVIAVADHDTIASVGPVTALAAERGVAVVPGVEVTTRWDGRQWHLLVYGAKLESTGFRALLDAQLGQLIARAEEAIAALKAHDYTLPSLDDVIGGRLPLPIYVMSALIRDGYADTHLAANQFVSGRLGVPFYVDTPLRDVVDAAHEAGGLAILAHPGRFEPEPLSEERLARLLTVAPLDGLEVYYPTHTPEQLALYGRLADQYGLLHSCGSDSHGPGWPRDPIPYVSSPIAPLLARLGYQIAEPAPRLV